MNLECNKPLYILPLDHRSSCEKNWYGWTSALSKEQTDKIARTKDVIYTFQESVDSDQLSVMRHRATDNY